MADEQQARHEPMRIVVGANGKAIVWPPIQCRCGRIVSFVINQGGITRCNGCAP